MKPLRPLAVLITCGLILAACGQGDETGPFAQVTRSSTTQPGSSTTQPGPAEVEWPIAVALDGGGRIVEFDSSTGQKLSTIYEGSRKAFGPISLNRADAKAVVYAALENTVSKCETAIVRASRSTVQDAGMVGIRPTISADARRLAYITISDRPVASPLFCPLYTLAVRDITSGSERRWTLAEGEGIAALVWARDGSKLYFQMGSEDGLGELKALAVDTATEGPLSSAGTAVDLGLKNEEWVERPHPVDDGVFLTIWCCKKDNEGLGTRESSTFGVLTATGVRRIESTVKAQNVVAVNPSATGLILFDSTRSELSRVRVDGADPVKIGTEPLVVVF